MYMYISIDKINGDVNCDDADDNDNNDNDNNYGDDDVDDDRDAVVDVVIIAYVAQPWPVYSY